MKGDWEQIKLDDWVANGAVELGRGDIISKDDIAESPGPYPIYSSSAHNNGKFGEYAKYMFNEELVTWSVDGGGNLFYRPKHKFSVTNVCGYMRVKSELLHAPFVYYCLADQHNYLTFDYTTKAHPSVIRKLYWLPSIDVSVQKRIVQILQALDQAIEKTELLIEKYQQIKAGLMHDLFTRGIGPDGKLRPPREQAPELYQETPIGWIPKDWGLPMLGDYADICSGVTLGSKVAPGQTIKVPYLRVANVQDGYLDLTEVKEILVSLKTLEALRLQSGDVLMNEGGDFDKLGRGTVWQGEIEPCIHQNHVFRVRVVAGLLRPYFLAYWSQSEFGKKYFVLSSKQSTNLASINSTQLHKFPVALPAIEEQEAIETRIGAVNERIDTLDAERQKLTTQKAGLMHDLLTGKVQVNADPPEVARV